MRGKPIDETASNHYNTTELNTPIGGRNAGIAFLKAYPFKHDFRPKAQVMNAKIGCFSSRKPRLHKVFHHFLLLNNNDPIVLRCLRMIGLSV